MAEWRAWKRDPLTYSSPVDERHLHAVPAPPSSGRGAGRRVDRAHGRRSALRWTRASPTSIPRSRRRSSSSAGWARPRAAVRYLRELVALDVEDAGDRDRLLAAGDRAAARDRALGRAISDVWPSRPMARGSWARSGTAGSSGSARYSATTRARSATAGRPSSTGSMPRCARSPRTRPGTTTTSRSCARTTRITHRPRRRCARRTRTGRSAPGSSCATTGS